MYTSKSAIIIPILIGRLKSTLKDGAEAILAEAKAQTPVDDGELIGSAAIATQDSNNSIEIVVHYGSDPVSKQYAVIQHENPYYNHPRGGNYKFLENPFNALAPKIMDDLKKSI
jgi:hypothetical protein